MAPVGIALIGGGIFAKEEHLPAILACSGLRLLAIYSRSLKSAQATADLMPDSTSKPDLYSEDSAKAYNDILQRSDIQAVVVCLPIKNGPDYIVQALGAGKHVFAEKPIAGDVAKAVEVMKYYDKIKAEKNVTLAIAENYRLQPALLYAAEQAGKLGRVTGFAAKVFFMIQPGNKWVETSWRKEPEHQGGFILDAGTHFVAPLRKILGKNDAIDTLSAYTSQVQEHLPPLDSVYAIMKTKNGVIGSWAMSAGTNMSAAAEWAFSFEKGSLTVTTRKVTVVTKSGDSQSDREEDVKEFEETTGVKEEFAAWAEALAAGQVNPLQTPEEALGDLEMLEKMFNSGEQNGAQQKMEFQ